MSSNQIIPEVHIKYICDLYASGYHISIVDESRVDVGVGIGAELGPDFEIIKEAHTVYKGQMNKFGFCVVFYGYEDGPDGIIFLYEGVAEFLKQRLKTAWETKNYGRTFEDMDEFMGWLRSQENEPPPA